MGNGILNCKRCSEYCVRRTNVEINNNLYGNYGEMNLDKAKSPPRIITNIFIPNDKNEFSPDSHINHNIDNSNKQNESKNYKTKTEKNWDNSNHNKEGEETQNNFTQFFNSATKNEKNVYISPSVSRLTSLNNLSNKIISFNNYISEMLNFINKLRNSPQKIIEDIDYILKNNLKKVDDKDFIITENSNEMIKLNSSFESIKDNLYIQQPVNILKLDNKLKINYKCENVTLTDKIINEIIIAKKKSIIDKYPECFFYPVFIKDIKISIIFLLENNIIKDKFFYSGFSDFYVTTFNEKSNRFFAILCLA